MGFSLGNINLGGIKDVLGGLTSSGSIGNLASSFNILSGGEGDSTLFSKVSEGLGNLKANFHQGLGNFMQSDFIANAGNALQGIAKTIDGLEIPEKIHDAMSGIRNWVCESGVVGKIAGEALNIFYGLGQMAPPPFNTIVGAMSQVVKPEAVSTIINKTLMHAEKELFEKLDSDGSAFTAFRKQVYETLSCQNIVEVTTMMAEDILETTYAATGENATPAEILEVVKKNFAEYENAEIVKDGKILLKEKTMPALKEAVEGTVAAGKAIATDAEIKGHVSAAVKAAPGAMTTAGQAIWQSLSGLGKFF